MDYFTYNSSDKAKAHALTVQRKQARKNKQRNIRSENSANIALALTAKNKRTHS